MRVPGSIAMTPDEIELCNEIKKAREHLARLEEDLLILRSNQPQRPAISASSLGISASPDWPKGDLGVGSGEREFIGDDGK